MDSFSNAEDFYSLAEEKFDFDVSLSSASSREDEGGEDEVFLGPGKEKENGICVGVENLVRNRVSSGPSVGEEQMWGPLPVDDFDRMCSEAQQLATQLKDDQPHTGQTDGTVPAERQGNIKDDFVQDTGSKLDMFSKPYNRVISPVKRETFCVQDSPLKLLPPAIQKRLLKGSSSSSSVGSGVGVKSTRARLSTSSPASASRTKAQPKMALRSKAGLGTSGILPSGILPSKPVVPATASSTSLKTAKTKAVPAENASRLAPSSKVGLRSKAPPLQTRGVVLDRRRNTSSSFSSVSSVNSSMSISPTGKGKVNASLNATVTGLSSRAPPNMGRLANTSAAKTRRSTVIGRTADPPPAPSAITVRGARRSIAVQSRKTSETDPTNLARSTPVKRAVPSTPTPFQQSPAKRASVSSVNSQQLGQRSKPMAFIAPTPSTRPKVLRRPDVVQSPESLKIMNPKRLRSAASLDSLLQEPVVPNPHLFHSTPSKSKIRRPSALPTPVNRSIAGIPGIPAMTPKRLPGSSPAGALITAWRSSNQSPTPVESATSEEEQGFSPKIQPFSLENADPAGLQTETQNEAQTETQNEALTCVKVQCPEVAQDVVDHPEENMEPQKEVVQLPKEIMEPQKEVVQLPKEIMEPQKEVVQLPKEIMEPLKEVVELPEENMELEPSGNLIELQSVDEAIAEDPGAKMRDVDEILLLDHPVSLFKPEDKPLIDLSNTPDLIRTVSHKTGEMQLIDLTSPLIKWSPEDKKENAVTEAPLINFSF